LPNLLAVIADPVFTRSDERFKSKTIKIDDRTFNFRAFSICLTASSKTSVALALAFRENVFIFDRQCSIF